MGLERFGAAGQIERHGFITPPGTVIDAQGIGVVARAICGHLPLHRAIGRGGQSRHNGPATCSPVKHQNFGMVYPSRIVGGSLEGYGFARAVGAAQICGGHIQHRPFAKTIKPHIHIGRRGGNIGITFRIIGGFCTSDGVAVDGY